MINLPNQKKSFKVFVLILVVLWFLFFLLQKINLTTADLGRHLKNGEMIFQGEFDVLRKNFYSYTYPDFSFLNHHWLAGAIFFLVYKISSFAGLHLFYIFLSIATFFIFLDLARKQTSMELAGIVSLLTIPLIAQRREIRPECFSYFFAAIFFWVLWHYKEKKICYKHLFILPAIQVIWVNTHIYWFLGWGITSVFFLEELISFKISAKKKKKNKKNKERIKNLAVIFLLIIFASFISPSGIKGAFHPANVYKNYGYRVLEEQSIMFLEKLGFIKNPNFLLFKITALMLILSFIFSFKKDRKNFSLSDLFLGVGTLVMAIIAIRNFTIFGFFALPIISSNLKNAFVKIKKQDILTLGLIIFIITLFTHYQNLPMANNTFGLGLMPEINQSAKFFKENNISGPIFNNYDIGGYLIYHLFPQEQVFVDNRPETYPCSFFQDIYIPLQENESFWQQNQEKYQFNAIFFYRHDATPWAQPFLIERVKDPDWAPVFVDDYSIIFLKQNKINQGIIEKYEIPENFFQIEKL